MIHKKKILIVSHDPGGAELLSSWVKHNISLAKYFFYLKGPAINIFKKKIKKINFVRNLKKNIINCDQIITSTSWESIIERKSIYLSKKNNKKVISLIDHWNNYKERFILKEKKYLPNEIWVTDRYAYKIAKKVFFKKIIKIKKNYYITELKKKIKNKKKTKKQKLLYLSEPIRDHAKKQHKTYYHWGYDEFSSLKYFFKNIDKITKNNIEIIFRKHPSEKIHKYKKILNDYSKKFKIIISKNNNLIYDLNNVDIVVGNQSMAMIIAIHAKKKVYSTFPKFKKPELPHTGINYLYNL